MSKYTIYKWFRIVQPDGTVREHSEPVNFHNLQSAREAYARLLLRVREPTEDGNEWGVSSPDVEADPGNDPELLELLEEVAPAADRIEMVRRLRGIKFQKPG